MIPVLYNKGGTEIIGDLADTISASVAEQRNGTYTAGFTYPYVSDYFSQIDYDSIVVMKPNQTSEPQKFRISSISKPINGIVTYNCEHKSYELNKNPVFNVSTFGDTAMAQDMLDYIFLSTAVVSPYTATSDITVVKKCELDFMSAREAIFKVQQYYGGELEWDNHNVILHNSRGVDNGAVISYGVNLIDYTQKLDVSNVYTAIAPYMQLENEDGSKTTYTLPESILTYANYEKFAYLRTKLVDFTDKFTEEELENLKDENGNLNETALINSLRSKANGYIVANFDLPNISHNITLSYVDLRKAKEFATIETMNDLSLCDYVTLKDERLGVNFKGQVISTKFNVLTEMYDSIEIGNPTDQLLNTLASIVNFKSDTTVGETVEEIEKNLDEYFSEINVTDNRIVLKSGNIKNIEGVYNTYGYTITRDTDIQEEGKKGKIIAFTDPKNRRTRITRK